ncbi:MAG: ABC-F family ATP-binding cassette domain-containing protein [Anaerolineales bacterium]|nr:ABC-F family ATP-binding cassette domain-containing protein [Anaerolineales bacterium]
MSRTWIGFLTGMAGIIAQQLLWAAVAPARLIPAARYNALDDPMSLLTASGLAKSYGAQDIFSGVSLAIPHQSRIGLVGPNGSGKTTLLRLLAGLDSPDAGRVSRSRSLRIGYLPQEALPPGLDDLQAQGGLWGFCLEALSDLRQQEAALTVLEAAMADPRRAEEAMARYGPMQESFERAGGYTYTARIKRVLSGLGFAADEFDRPLARLSGGEKTRAYLARLILEDPDLLLLDEPTNHLDVQALEWLEGWLREWPGAVLAVSHDRYFLDRVVDQVWELEPAGIEIYRGSYTAYAQQRQERKALLAQAYRRQQAFVESESDYIARNIAGQNTRQAQGRRKRLERMLRQKPVERLRPEASIHFTFGQTERSGDRALETHSLQVGHADSPEALFSVPDLVLQRGECAALLGPNGAGKTTFLRTLLGEIEPRTGKVQLGASIRLGYFAQAHADLDPSSTALQSVMQADPSLTPATARDWLARFLLRGDSVDKTVDVLSGGERGRLALARLVLQGANLLLLDEPTSHLDLTSQETLQAALSAYDGTILLVSHDRYLVNALATQVWSVVPPAQHLQVTPGNYDQMLEMQPGLSQPAQAKPAAAGSSSRRRSRPARSVRKLETLEADIRALEQTLTDVGAQLQVAGSDLGRVRDLGQQYAQLEADLQAALGEWERLAAEMEEGPVI